MSSVLSLPLAYMGSHFLPLQMSIFDDYDECAYIDDELPTIIKANFQPLFGLHQNDCVER
ncbi:hypothetical protein L484_014087 [Morus notabilis]|uniref:Uncharacterized protein n=1 Tax=Morus notabilis TaxID=981085 RepID=W9RBX6_9ROSA|nr:hypothetical protein L484_014087 [Morus notabilis]